MQVRAEAETEERSSWQQLDETGCKRAIIHTIYAIDLASEKTYLVIKLLILVTSYQYNRLTRLN
jgi:hypothetical protein